MWEPSAQNAIDVALLALAGTGEGFFPIGVLAEGLPDWSQCTGVLQVPFTFCKGSSIGSTLGEAQHKSHLGQIPDIEAIGAVHSYCALDPAEIQSVHILRSFDRSVRKLLKK